MEAIQLDGDILFGLLKKTSPAIHKHLKDQDVMPILYMQVLLISSTLKIMMKFDLLGVVSLHLCTHPPLAVCSQGDYHDHYPEDRRPGKGAGKDAKKPLLRDQAFS